MGKLDRIKIIQESDVLEVCHPDYPTDPNLPSYYLDAVIFFCIDGGILGFSDSAVRLGLSSFYPYFKFPITYVDYLAALIAPEYRPYVNDELTELEIEAFFLKDIYSSLVENHFKANSLEEAFTYSKFEEAINNYFMYMIRNLYLRICNSTGCSCNLSVPGNIKQHDPFFYWRNSYSYMTDESIVCAIYIRPNMTYKLFPRKFIKRNIGKFAIIPKEELLFFSNTDPGFSYLLPRI